MKQILSVLIAVIASMFYGLAQETFDIKNPGAAINDKCNDCFQAMTSMPREVKYGVQQDEFGKIYFVMTDKTWFDKLFANRNDGFAIDIVTKEQYVCNSKNKPITSAFSKGTLLKPLYLKGMDDKIIPAEKGQVVILYGQIPKELLDKEYELNVIYLKDKNFCHYRSLYNLQSFSWELLDMGMYMDTITYKAKQQSNTKQDQSYILNSKRLIFTIPFERNKSEYNAQDIKPLYDSLRLTDFNITTMTIRSYSSVEGSVERNMDLQQKRAESITKALQTFQNPAITTNIQVSENWVEFYNDILGSSFANLGTLSKEEIKLKLKDEALLTSMDPVLKKHRKAVIIIELEKKNSINKLTEEMLIEEFDKAIKEKNIARATEIQENIFQRIGEQSLPTSLINKLDIPKQKDFVSLLNNRLAFRYMNNSEGILKSYLDLQELSDLFPDNGHIKYNICALKFKVWLLGDAVVDEKEFLKEINALSKYNINNSLIKRMLVNYNIVMGEFYLLNQDYKNKDKCVQYIYNNYKQVPYNPSDLLSLAQYFTTYSKYDWAIKLLTPYVTKVDVDEDLLFYYLNLTLIDPKQTKNAEYRRIMLNAINLNKQRFCSLFNAYNQGGVSFQLLENDFLKITYCENCSKK